jgi:hypothetical protein
MVSLRLVTLSRRHELGTYLCRLLFRYGYEPIRFRGFVITLDMAELKFLSVQEAVVNCLCS